MGIAWKWRSQKGANPLWFYIVVIRNMATMWGNEHEAFFGSFELDVKVSCALFICCQSSFVLYPNSANDLPKHQVYSALRANREGKDSQDLPFKFIVVRFSGIHAETNIYTVMVNTDFTPCKCH